MKLSFTMTSIYLAIIIQASISSLFLYSKRRKQFLLLHLYALVIGTDFIFELFIYQYFEGSPLYLDLLPSSFRLLKGPLLLYFTLQLIGRKINAGWWILMSVPFIFYFVFNLIAIKELFVLGQFSKVTINLHLQLFKFYFYYWIGFISISTYFIIKYYDHNNLLIKNFLILLLFLAITVFSYYIAYNIGVESNTIRAIYRYFFFIQFALLLNIVIRSFQTLNTSQQEHQIRKEKYKHSRLDTSDLAEIAHSIREYFETQTDFTSEEFSLNHLSSVLEIPKHQLSQAITDGLKTNFYELLNSYRLKLFIQLLQENPSVSISDLSFQVGFRSRTTFYKYFKVKMGVTPSAYKAQMKV